MKNRAACFGEIPKSSAKEIVAPDLEIPGVIANPWAIPISGECQNRKRLST